MYENQNLFAPRLAYIGIYFYPIEHQRLQSFSNLSDASINHRLRLLRLRPLSLQVDYNLSASELLASTSHYSSVGGPVHPHLLIPNQSPNNPPYPQHCLFYYLWRWPFPAFGSQ